MTRMIKATVTRIHREPLSDIIGGVWLVTLLLSLMHLPNLIG